MNKFFIKTFSGFLLKSKNNSIDLKNLISLNFSLSKFSNNELFLKPNYNILINLLEPFIYLLLSNLNLGPKINFIFNPYLINGFYYLSSSLTNLNQCFLEISKINNDIQNLKEFTLYIGFFEIISKFFFLTDFNEGNIGFVLNNNEIKPYIIDFRINFQFFNNEYLINYKKNIINNLLNNLIFNYLINEDLNLILKESFKELFKKYLNNFQNILINSKNELIILLEKKFYLNNSFNILGFNYNKDEYINQLNTIDLFIKEIILNFEILKNYFL